LSSVCITSKRFSAAAERRCDCGQVEIFRRARHRPEHGQIDLAQRSGRPRDVAAVRNDAVGGLVRVDAAPGRRVAHRAGDVAALFETCQAGGERRGRAARGPARRPREVPGVARHPEDRIVALRVARERGQIGLAEDDRARFDEPLDGDRVGLGHVRREGLVAGRRPQARRLDAVLDGDRQAVQRTEELVPRRRLVRLVRLGARSLDV
jgi:hypothetical protein